MVKINNGYVDKGVIKNLDIIKRHHINSNHNSVLLY